MYNSSSGDDAVGNTLPIVQNLNTIAEDYDSITKAPQTQDRRHENAAAPYEPYDFGKAKNPTTFHGTIFHLLLISAGPALLAMPKIYLGVGNVIGFFGTLFIIGLYNHCCHIFTKVEYDLCKQKRVPNLTYSDIIYHSFLLGPVYLRSGARYARYLVYVVFIIPWLGGNSLNLLLISENLQLALKLLFDHEVGIRTVMLYTFVPLLLLCWIPSLKLLVPISLFGNILNILVVLVVFYHTIYDPPYVQKQSVTFDWLNIPIFFGSVLYCTNAFAILMPLKNDMKNPRKFTSKLGVLNVSNFITVILYATFNLLCCLKYGNTLLDNVVMNLPRDQFSSKLTILMYVIAVCFQFPLVSYVVFDLFWNVLLVEKKAKLNNLLLWEYVARSTVVAGAYILAVAIPSIEMFITITGTLASPVDGLVFPCIADQVMRYKELKCAFKLDMVFVKNFLISGVGIVLMISGLISCVQRFFSS